MLLIISRLWRRRSPGTGPIPCDARELDEVRFEALVAAHLDAIYRTARRLGVHDSEVADLAQEVLMVLSRRLEDIDVDKERAFALGTTARMAANFRRKARRRRESLVDEIVEGDEVHPLASSPDPGGESCVQRAEALALLRAGLQAMTEAQRETFVLFELEELHASEIAAHLGIAEGAVASRLTRARQVMRRVCQRLEPEVSESYPSLESESLP